MKNYGFIQPQITPDNWVLGAIPQRKILEPEGDWTKYLPLFEKQHANFDTHNCTGFGTATIMETLHKRITSKPEENYSDRFIGICAGTYPPGNDPHKVAESIRKNRVVPEQTLPFSPDLKNVDEYYSFKGADEMKLRNLAKSYPYELNHWWLWTTDQTKEQRKEKIREALKTSPLGVSVSAWYKRNGVYVDKGQPNNHWCVLYGEEKDKGWKVYDSYDESHKILSYDHNIQFAKGFQLVLKEHEEITILKQMIDLLKQAIRLFLSEKKTQ